ncbi:MAG TPA: choice-of-anchor P family protein [Mycobacteriales bacterium]|nr:choice-of-anchor P family protein [Mycobacteriales bacterium]
MGLFTKSFAGVGALSVALLLAAPAGPAVAQSAAPPAGGFADAKGIILNVTALGLVTVPTAPITNSALDPNTFSNASQSCPPQVAAPATDNFPMNINASPAVTANTLNTLAGANCAVPSAVASAQVEGLTALINAGAPTITADLIRAQANSDCVKAPNADGSLFVNLRIAGQPVANNPAPNTVYTIPNVATVIVNEQRPTADGRGIVVNGIHIIGLAPAAGPQILRGDIVISHAVSGVVCPNGKGSEIGPGLKAPDIKFDKKAVPSTAKAGDTVVYTATVTNTSAVPCDVLAFIDHLSPVFDLVSTDGAFGKTLDTTVPKRADGGVDATIRPKGVTIGAGKSVVQTFTVTLKADTAPGTYYDTLEIFCGPNGNFASGPLAPVTVGAPKAPKPPARPKPPVAEPELPRTGAAPLLALGALALVGTGLVLRRRIAK